MSIQAAYKVFVKSNVFAGLEVLFDQDMHTTVNLVILKKTKGRVHILHAYEGLSIGEAKQHLVPGMPVHLVINGKGIVHKPIPQTDVGNQDTLFEKILPNAETDKFYFQLKPGAVLNIASVVRKEQVDHLLNELSPVPVITCYAGPFITEVAADFFDTDPVIIQAAGFELNFSAGLLTDFKRTDDQSPAETPVKIGDEYLAGNLLVAYSAALDYYYDLGDSLRIERIGLAEKEFHAQRKLKMNIAVLGIASFLILLVNFICFSYFFEKNKELEAGLNAGVIQLSYLDSLRAEYRHKKEFLSDNGLLGSSRVSFYADDLAHNMPGSITLSRLMIFPPLKKTEQDALLYESGIIRLTGECGSTIVLNDWIKMLQAKEWVSGVSVLNVVQDRDEKMITFNLQLHVR